MGTKPITQKNLMIKILTTPFRAIRKAKDFYIRSITDCANHTNYARPVMTYGNPLSRTTSASSFGSSVASEDLRELIRANSTTSMNNVNINRSDLELYIKHQQQQQQQQQHMMIMGSRKVPRSVSVGMGRIDEDVAVSSFNEEEDLGRKVKSDHMVFNRSKSHAVTSNTKVNSYS
ncbi:uncharacterized protein [Rutidosis leptorrhynchoides]|uniref:uncharacterized protein n=1 Tax=Rutidosis leptorrhynchoides TaxID=125765 RepID=UPI003A9A1D1D